jgi:glycosyltransferase involved in cell wall biosynthesis
MGTKEYGGLGEVMYSDLPEFISHYRFFFNPIRYTSMGLAVIEAMMTGMPVVALATTEYITVIKNHQNGFINTDIDYLVHKMELLLSNKSWAANMGANGKQYAEERFNIYRFTEEWQDLFEAAIFKKETYEKEHSIYQ